MTVPNAALLYSASGFSTSGAQLMGINAASEGMVRAFARYAGLERLTALVWSTADGEHFKRAVHSANPGQATRIVPLQDLDQVAAVGALMLPGPVVAEHAWQRQALGSAAYSLIGITHTTATPRVMDALVAVPSAPVEPWDAILCTSQAVRTMVVQLLEDQEAYLRQRFSLPAKSAMVRPQLPVIPLGVDCAALAPQPGLRQDWRARLGIGPDDVVALYLGRLSHHQKAHPIPLFQAMQIATEQSRTRLMLVMAGWFLNAEIEAAFRAAAWEFCPDVPVVFMDGRLPDVQAASRAMADLFVSPVDNVQETFGLSPVEAMAAGLPVVVSDWNGYRETVRDGGDGFLVPTLAPPPGICDDLALRFSSGLDGYDAQMGAVGQTVVVDIEAMAAAISRLADDPALRRTMGQSAQMHARAAYDWPSVVAQHRALWAELGDRRRHAVCRPAPYPARPDPFHVFRNYPSETLSDDCTVHRQTGDERLLARLLDSRLVRFGQPGEPDPAQLLAVLGAADGCRIGTLTGGRRESYRAVLWLAKYGLVTIRR